MTMKTLLIAGALFACANIANAEEHIVKISGSAFLPSKLTIAVGDTVTFVNKDSPAHTATLKDKSMETGRLGNNQKGSLIFDTAGSFKYYCNFHRSMTGEITVQ